MKLHGILKSRDFYQGIIEYKLLTVYKLVGLDSNAWVMGSWVTRYRVSDCKIGLNKLVKKFLGVLLFYKF